MYSVMATFLSTCHHDEKISPPQPVEGGGLHAHPLSLYTITYKVFVLLQLEREDTLLLFILYHYMYSVMTTFWRTSHHDGEISPVWRQCGGGGRTPTPLSIIYPYSSE
jgi:hypothetical protein